MEEGTYETFPETVHTDHYKSDEYQRVAIYARASTDDVSQTTSFELQKKYYMSYVIADDSIHDEDIVVNTENQNNVSRKKVVQKLATKQKRNPESFEK